MLRIWECLDNHYIGYNQGDIIKEVNNYPLHLETYTSFPECICVVYNTTTNKYGIVWDSMEEYLKLLNKNIIF